MTRQEYEAAERQLAKESIAAYLTCPECHGQPVHGYSIACGSSGGIVKSIETCRTCGGGGYISLERANWIKDGEARRLDRIARGLSTREEAARLRIKPQHLNEIENGKRAFSAKREIGYMVDIAGPGCDPDTM